MKIDTRSETWEAITAFAKQERKDAIESLIGDRSSEQQRGAIDVLDKLLALADKPDKPIVENDY